MAWRIRAYAKTVALWVATVTSKAAHVGSPLGARHDRELHFLPRHKRCPHSRRTPRRGTGVDDVGEPGPRMLDLHGLGTWRLQPRRLGAPGDRVRGRGRTRAWALDW